MVALPSFREEYAVFLACGAAGVSIVVREAPVWMLYYDQETGQPHDTTDVLIRLKRVVHEYVRPVSSDTVELLRMVWTSMLAHVDATGHHSNGIDGEYFHFCHRGLAGKTWSPTADSPCERLVATADAMRELASDAPIATDHKLVACAKGLLARIPNASGASRGLRQLTCR